MGKFIQVRVKGAKEIQEAFASLEQKLRASVLRKTVAEGAKVYLKALKQAAPKESKLLAKSLGTRAKNYKKGLIATRTIGARSGFRQEVVVKVRDKSGKVIGKRKQMRDPRRYAHITEKRTPWIRPTHDAYTGQAVEAMTGKLKTELEIAIQASSTAHKVR